jgi:hypothetical protein
MSSALDDMGAEVSGTPAGQAPGGPSGSTAATPSLAGIPVRVWAELGRARMPSAQVVGLPAGAACPVLTAGAAGAVSEVVAAGPPTNAVSLPDASPPVGRTAHAASAAASTHAASAAPFSALDPRRSQSRSCNNTLTDLLLP